MTTATTTEPATADALFFEPQVFGESVADRVTSVLAAVAIGAAVVSVHVLLWVGVNALFADALVQRPELSEVDASSALWASSLVGLIAALVQAGTGWPLRAAMGDPRIGAMTLALALRLAAYELLRAEGSDPVLLLDDVARLVAAGRDEKAAGPVLTLPTGG